MERKQAANLVNCVYIGLLAAGILLPALRESKREKQRSLRALEAVGTSVLVGQVVKRIVPELRPDGRDKTSFPSGHTAYAFSVAAISAAFTPKRALFWLFTALFIGIERVRLRRHHWWDALAGGLLGLSMAYSNLTCREGFLVPMLRATSKRLTLRG